MRVQTFRLQKELVRSLVRELDDLVFDAGAVTRANALDLPGIHRRAMHVFADDAMRFRGGESDIARHLLLRDLFCAEAERRGIGIAGLGFESRPVDGAAVETRRRARLQAAAAQTQQLERLAQKL